MRCIEPDPNVTVIEKDTVNPPPGERDTIRVENFRKFPLLLEDQKVIDPLVLLPEFGRYNYDVVRTLPNPHVIFPQYQDPSGDALNPQPPGYT